MVAFWCSNPGTGLRSGSSGNMPSNHAHAAESAREQPKPVTCDVQRKGGPGFVVRSWVTARGPLLELPVGFRRAGQTTDAGACEDG